MKRAIYKHTQTNISYLNIIMKYCDLLLMNIIIMKIFNVKTPKQLEEWDATFEPWRSNYF